MAALPQPFPGAKDRLVGDLSFVDGHGTFIKGLWFNQIAPDRRFEITTNVRRAVAYALDREQIADVALGSIINDPLVLQCAGWNPAFGDWCHDDFAGYAQDMAAVTELLTADGWSRPDAEGLWVNAEGEPLVIQWNTVAGNKRREDVQALVAEMTDRVGRDACRSLRRAGLRLRRVRTAPPSLHGRAARRGAPGRRNDRPPGADRRSASHAHVPSRWVLFRPPLPPRHRAMPPGPADVPQASRRGRGRTGGCGVPPCMIRCR